MIAFIDKYRDRFGVEPVCRTLQDHLAQGFITSRGYRAAKRRPPSARSVEDEQLIPILRQLHAASYGVYGYRKMWKAMRRQGWEIGRDHTARLMQAAGLQGVRRGRKPATTTPASKRGQDARPDLVQRDFHPIGPGRLWLADITYVRVVDGFAYTAFITDAYSRKIVGWAVSSSLHTQSLPLSALEHALLTTGATRDRRGGLVHHSDRGSQYVSLAYSDALIASGISASVGTVGDSYDNAMAETVNGSYKAELIHARRVWPSVQAVEIATLEWVGWWNHQRLHTSLDYHTPAEVEAAYNQHHAPAPVGE